MKRIRKRKCRHCGELFYPDRRNVKRQRYCSKAACKRASKGASQRKWLRKPENRNYFRGRSHLERVREWRKKNPGYWRRSKGPKVENALQDDLLSEVAETKGENGVLVKSALQDIYIGQRLVMIGLIASLRGTALQDDIAQATRELAQLGRDIVGSAQPFL